MLFRCPRHPFHSIRTHRQYLTERKIRRCVASPWWFWSCHRVAPSTRTQVTTRLALIGSMHLRQQGGARPHRVGRRRPKTSLHIVSFRVRASKRITEECAAGAGQATALKNAAALSHMPIVRVSAAAKCQGRRWMASQALRLVYLLLGEKDNHPGGARAPQAL